MVTSYTTGTLAAEDDNSLALQAHRNSEAFTMLYQRHFLRVYRYHVLHTGNIADAEDLTSITFMAALESMRNYRGTGSFAAWLMGIARNKKALFFRGRKPEVPLETVIDMPDSAAPMENIVGRRLRIGLIQRALRDLAPDRAEAITLCLFSDLTAAEAARALGKSEAAVKMLVFRGLRDLRSNPAINLEVSA